MNNTYKTKLLIPIAFFLMLGSGYGDFKIKNNSYYTIEVQPVTRRAQKVGSRCCVLVYTSFNEVTVRGPFDLNMKTSVPNNKTLIVEYKFGSWSIRFEEK